MTLNDLFTDVEAFHETSISSKGFKGLALGVLYSLKRAEELRFTNRVGAAVGPDYSAELDAASSAIAGNQAMPKEWLAGFYFNSALVRIAAGSHRALRVIYKTNKGSFATLARRAIRDGQMSEGDIDWLRKVYNDVNAFKHDGHAELLQKRKVETLAQGISAAGQLLKLLRKAV